MTWGRGARLAVGPLLLVAIAWLLDPRRIAAELADFDPRWLAPMVGLSLIQFGVSAWRWRFTAEQLGLALSRRAAITDYYLAVFLNNCLPSGVMGDALRAWRHGRSCQQPGRAAKAVIIERVSGQLVLWAGAAMALVLSPEVRGLLTGHPAATSLLALVVTVGGVGAVYQARRRPGAALPRALTGRRVWPVQLVSSLVVVTTYVAIYVLCARAIGITRPAVELVPLILPVLVAMAVPVSVAGWGVRESAAAIIWTVAGLPPDEGVAVAVAYGIANLVLALPGLGVAIRVAATGQMAGGARVG